MTPLVVAILFVHLICPYPPFNAFADAREDDETEALIRSLSYGVVAMRSSGQHEEAYDAYRTLRRACGGKESVRSSTRKICEDALKRAEPRIKLLPYPDDGLLRRRSSSRTTLRPGEDVPIYVISMESRIDRRRLLVEDILRHVPNPVHFVRATPNGVRTDEYGYVISCCVDVCCYDHHQFVDALECERRTHFSAWKGWELDEQPHDAGYDTSIFSTLVPEGFAFHKVVLTLIQQFHFRPLKEGEIGLAIDHYRIWSHAFHSGHEHVIILEDDASFAHGPSVPMCSPNSRCDKGDFVDEKRSFAFPDALMTTSRRDEWDQLYFGGIDIVQRDPFQDVSDGLTSVRGFLSGVSYALSRSGLRKVLSEDYHRYLIPLDEFFPALALRKTFPSKNTQVGGHVRPDIRFIFKDRPAFNAYHVEPLRVVETDTEMSDEMSTPTSFVEVRCPLIDSDASSFVSASPIRGDHGTRDTVKMLENKNKWLIPIRVDDRTAIFMFNRHDLVNSTSLWTMTTAYCDSVVPTWWERRSRRRGDRNGRRIISGDVAELMFLTRTCVDVVSKCAAYTIMSSMSDISPPLRFDQHDLRGRWLTRQHRDDRWERLVDDVANVIVHALNDVTQTHHPIGTTRSCSARDNDTSCASSHEESVVSTHVNERQYNVSSTRRPTVMVMDCVDIVHSNVYDRLRRPTLARELRNWYHFIVDAFDMNAMMASRVDRRGLSNDDEIFFPLDLTKTVSAIPLLYDWIVAVSDVISDFLSTANDEHAEGKVLSHLCSRARTGIIVRWSSSLFSTSDSMESKFRTHGFVLDMPATEILRAGARRDAIDADDNRRGRGLYVFRRDTSRPFQSWITCQGDQCKWQSLVKFGFRVRQVQKGCAKNSSPHTYFPVMAYVNQGDSVLDKAVETCRDVLATQCAMGRRRLSLFAKRNSNKADFVPESCEAHPLTHNTTTEFNAPFVVSLTRWEMVCVESFLRRFNANYGRTLLSDFIDDGVVTDYCTE